MDPREIARLRLSHLLIDASSATRAVEVASRLGALQAQDHTGVLWSIGVRLPGSTEASVEAALASREVVRSWPLRGTIHVVAADDLAWMLELLGPRVIHRASKRAAQLGLDDATFAECRRIVEKVLAGGVAMERDELLEAITAHGVPTDPHRGYHICWRLALERVLCFGPRAGKQLTFVLFDEWLGPKRSKKPLFRGEAALGEIARRYFTSHGPATIGDLTRWTGLNVGEARTGVEVAGDALSSVTAGKKTYYLPREPAPAAEDAPIAHLLSGFDEYLLGYEDKSAVLDDDHLERVVPGMNGIFRATIVVDGRIVGTWKTTKTKKKLKVVLEPFGALKKRAKDAIAEAADRYGAFMGLPAEVA